MTLNRYLYHYFIDCHALSEDNLFLFVKSNLIIQLSFRYEIVLIDRFLLLLLLHGILMIATNVAGSQIFSSRKFLYLMLQITTTHKNMKM